MKYRDGTDVDYVNRASQPATWGILACMLWGVMLQPVRVGGWKRRS